MAAQVKPIPDDYPVVTPYLTLENAAEALAFYQKAFGATERMRIADPSGAIMHAEIEIGGHAIMLAEECPQQAATRNPRKLGGSGVGLYIYVEDVDAIVSRAAVAGAEVISSPKDQFYGDRSSTLRDPYGHIWYIATRIENVSPEETARRAAECMKQHAVV
jgi:PhnB protein